MNSETPTSDFGSIAGRETGLAGGHPANSRTPGLVQQVGLSLTVAALAVASYLVISHFFLEGVSVVGMSMTPTLQNAQRYLLNRWVFHLRPPRAAEVVVLRDPADNGYSVKRVIAIGGDSVYLTGGDVFVNGHKLEEPYLLPGTRTFANSSSRDMFFKCAPEQYFVMGDNRNNSVDSRLYGPVPRANILGLIVH